MRSSHLLLALILLTASCGTTTEEALTPSQDLQRCQFQALSFGFAVAGEELFVQMQAAVSEDGIEVLTPEQSAMLAALTVPTEFGRTSFSPVRSKSVVQPGTTTLEQFRIGTGLLEYLDYMATMGGEFATDREIELNQRFFDDLQMACDSRQEELLSEACAGGDSEACRLVDNLDQLDPAIVAEACELTPYMLFCDPEDPIPWELPPLDDE